MSRPLRIEYPGAWHHVMNRGRRSEKIFYTDHDRKSFIKILQEASELWNLRVAAYCLMDNHYHLLIQTPDGDLSRGMRHINSVYTQRFNRRHEKEGQLFRGRYKAVLVEADSHLLEVLRYIHRNPVKAGIVKSLKDYQWSSHQGYLSRAKKWAWVHKGDLLAMLAVSPARQKSAYLNFVAGEEPEEIEKFYSLKNLPAIMGGESFKDMIREKFASLLNRTEIPEAKTLVPDVERVIAAAYEFYGVSRAELMQSRRGVSNPGRDAAIYLVRTLCRMSLPEVGQVFGIKNYSSVSSAVQRVKARLKTGKMKKILEAIRQKALKGQKRT